MRYITRPYNLGSIIKQKNMIKEKWEQIRGDILDKFEVEDSGKEHIDDEGGVDVEFIVFESPLGKVRLEFISKPVVLDKKTTYSRRIGSETNVEYVYSENEKNEHLIAYKWNNEIEEWEEMDASAFDV